MNALPQYACAILEDANGKLLLESRPANARLAAGRLTCFGGRREAGESPEECVRRELQEELGWEPRSLQKCVELWVAGELVAWFFKGVLDVGADQLRVAPGHQARLVRRDELAALPVSPWHAAVLDAWFAGRAVVEIN